MRYEFEYEYSDELLRAASRRNIRHQIGWRVPITLALTLALIAALCMIDGRGYLCVLLQGALGMLVVLVVLAHAGAKQRALRFARKLPTRRARCIVTDEAITVESALAASTLHWPVVQQVVRGSDVWL